MAGCGPSSPTMAVYQQKVQESSSCSVHEAGMFQLAITVCQSPDEVASKASKGMDLPVRVRAGRPNQNLLSSVPFVYRLPAEDVAQIKGGASQLRRSGLKVDLPISIFSKSN